MSERQPSPQDHHESGLYEIRVGGHLNKRWDDWFEGLTVTRTSNGETMLTGIIADQSALHGMLRKIRDLGIPLRSVNRIESGDRDDNPQE